MINAANAVPVTTVLVPSLLCTVQRPRLIDVEGDQFYTRALPSMSISGICRRSQPAVEGNPPCVRYQGASGFVNSTWNCTGINVRPFLPSQDLSARSDVLKVYHRHVYSCQSMNVTLPMTNNTGRIYNASLTVENCNNCDNQITTSRSVIGACPAPRRSSV